MTKLEIPYGHGNILCELDAVSVETLHSRVSEISCEPDEDKIVLEAMASPIASPRLAELAKGKNSATVLISDHTRPVPSKHIIPFMLKELRDGNPAIDITLLVATGCHRDTTKEELTDKLGADIVERERIIVHDCLAGDTHVDMGVLPSGAHLIMNKAGIETDLLIAEGFIEPHFFAGFSGGRKSVLPGICSRVTVLGNHCSRFIDNPNARAGVLTGNPIQEDMLAACKMSRLKYIVNVIIDSEKKVVAAFAGDPAAAHQKGCDTLASYCRVRPKQKGDVVISSNGGFPLDQNIYQAVKGLSAAESAAKEGAILIFCAECADGAGGDQFFEAMSSCESPESLLAQVLTVPMEETTPDQWQYQILARVLSKHTVLFVSRPELRETLEKMKLTYMPDLSAALQLAREQKGANAHYVVMPDGVSVIIE